jgi:hypothetical protein
VREDWYTYVRFACDTYISEALTFLVPAQLFDIVGLIQAASEAVSAGTSLARRIVFNFMSGERGTAT